MLEKRRNVCDRGDRIAAFHNFPEDISAFLGACVLDSPTVYCSEFIREDPKHLDKWNKRDHFVK